MATKRKKPKESVIATAADKFIGLSGAWKNWTNLGMAGIVAGISVYLLTVTIPNAQQSFHDELRMERDAARVELEKSRQHGKEAVKALADSISKQAEVAREANNDVKWYYTQHLANQSRILDTLKKDK